MCYTREFQHKGIKIVISDCFGVGFDWNDPKLRQAVEDRSESIWEILEWMSNGGAERANKILQFSSYIISSKENALYAFKNEYSNEYLQEVLTSPYLSERAKNLIFSFYDGSLEEEIKAKRAEEKKNKISPGKKGFVYLIRAENGLYKIGKAKNVSTRLQPFSVHFPMKWDLVHSFRSNNYSDAEKNLHGVYAEKRDIGEWFKLSEEDVNHIMAIQDNQL